MGIIRKTILLYLIILFQFFLARLALISLYYDLFASLGVSEIMMGFIEGARFDLSSITVFLCIPILMLNLPFKFILNKYWSNIWLSIIWLGLIIGIGFLVGDIIYFDFVKRHISHELFMMTGNDMNGLVGMSFGLFWPYLLTYLFIIILNIYIGVCISKIKISDFSSFWKKLGRFLGTLVLIVIVARGGFGYKPIAVIDAFAKGSTAYGNLVLNGIFTSSHAMLKSRSVTHNFYPQDKALENIKDITALSGSEFPIQKEVKGKTETKYNLVFVLIESLSFKYVDYFSGRNLGITPNIDQLAKEGIAFNNFYAAGQRSVEGIQATLTGIPSIIGNSTIGTGILANYSRLGELAKNNGYSTLFVQSLKRDSFRGRSIAGAAGFKNYYGMEDMPVLLDYPDPAAAKYGWDYETYMFTADKMSQLKKPFISYIITSTTHTPYPELPKELMKFPHSKNKEEGFLNTVNYTDWSIGEFIKKAKKSSSFDNTIFIFTADHALAHYQTGGYLEKFKIPLVIYAPKIFKPQVIETVGSQLDLFDTIADILKLKGKYSSLGKSLFQKKKENSYAITREGSIMGIISDKGFLRHTLKNRLETGKFNEKISSDYFNKLEEKLLSFDQISSELIRTNKWAE